MKLAYQESTPIVVVNDIIDLSIMLNPDDLVCHPFFNRMWNDAGFSNRVEVAIYTKNFNLMSQVQAECARLLHAYTLRTGNEPKWMMADQAWEMLLTAAHKFQRFCGAQKGVIV